MITEFSRSLYADLTRKKKGFLLREHSVIFFFFFPKASKWECLKTCKLITCSESPVVTGPCKRRAQLRQTFRGKAHEMGMEMNYN